MNYYIASLKHTGTEQAHIVFWAKESRGYTAVFGERIGLYTHAEALALNDGYDNIAVPETYIDPLLSPDPQYKPGCWNYDQRGKVIKNTRDNWNYLNTARLKETKYPPFKDAIKPTPFARKDTLLYPIDLK